ncbi:MAG: DUF1501 domain-containing protein [Burkholderiales bacterium]|nr:DUF1501 domain-containing protein [Burkholderiales bacterium]
MRRREFVTLAAGAGLSLWFHGARAADARAAGRRADYRRRLVLIELNGGNDGLNTLVPFADPQYASLRPRLALAREQLLQISEREALHPALAALLPLWQAGELALVQGVGYPSPNLSHFRSIEIWDTASRAEEYLRRGWLARAFEANPVPAGFAAPGVSLGGQSLGPLAGSRSIALADPERFQRQARLAAPAPARGPAALRHVLAVEADVAQAAARLPAAAPAGGNFPAGPFGNALRAAAEVAQAGSGVAAYRLSLGGFDTHQNQAAVHASLLRQLAEGIAAYRAAMVAAGLWDDTLVLTYAEFGRRAAENGSSGTDHGTASVHFAAGGRVHGGLYGEPPRLDRLENGNLPFAVDFRSLYATALEGWWSMPSAPVLNGRFAPLPILRA